MGHVCRKAGACRILAWLGQAQPLLYTAMNPLARYSSGWACPQYISKTRPSRFVILSASEGSLSGQRSFARAQDDTPASASFDSQNVLFSWNWLFHASG